MIILILAVCINMIYAKELTCKHKYMDKIWGTKIEACYAKNYTDYTPKQAANEFLQDQVYVKGGRFNLNNNPKTHVKLPGFYIGKYLVPFQQYNAYLKATKQWHKGFMQGQGRARLRRKIYNGLYPATATYQNAEGFCQWMGKLTGLDVTLPQYVQWLYAATSRGTNWAYPTNNGKLEIGINYPPIQKKGSLANTLLVTDKPVNSLGIHQIFGNGYQWSRSILTNENAPYFNVGMPAMGGHILGGYFYATSDLTPEILKQITLSSDFAIAVPKKRKNEPAEFRCVINTEKPLPKSVPAS